MLNHEKIHSSIGINKIGLQFIRSTSRLQGKEIFPFRVLTPCTRWSETTLLTSQDGRRLILWGRLVLCGIQVWSSAVGLALSLSGQPLPLYL